MSWRQVLVWGGGALLVLAAIGYGFMPRPVLVDATEVSRGPLEVTVREEGETRVVERYVVSAPVAAYARRVELDIGDSVTEGEVLARLDPLRPEVLDPRRRAEAEARVQAAAAAVSRAGEEVAAAEADAALARTELERIQTLWERGAVARERLDQAEADARRSTARLEAARRAADVARHDLEAARTALRYSAADPDGAYAETVPVRSPVTGRVLSVAHESEGVVMAGASLLEVGNPVALEVAVEVLSADAVRITPGMEVRLERWGGEDHLDGVVRRVEPVGFTEISALGVEEQRVRVIVDLVSPPDRWERLGDGYRVEAVFLLWVGDDVLRTPSSALFRHDEGWAVFVVEDGEARLRRVEIGHRAGLTTEVVSGLEAGERVIAHPDDAIEDGTAVELRES